MLFSIQPFIIGIKVKPAQTPEKNCLNSSKNFWNLINHKISLSQNYKLIYVLKTVPMKHLKKIVILRNFLELQLARKSMELRSFMESKKVFMLTPKENINIQVLI